MPCEHSYGIIRNLDSEKDYAKLEGFDTFAAAIQAYKNDVEIKIDMQGLRKSGAMYKLRLSDYDYQAVQLETGHSTPNVLMEHYNEVMASEKSRLAEKFENDFYAGREVKAEIRASGIEELFQAVMADPEQLAALSKFMALQSVQV